MTEIILNSFFDYIVKDGHNTASALHSIQFEDFDVFCSDPLFSADENYQMLEYQKQGCYLYNNYNMHNPNFIQDFKKFLGGRIIEEYNIISDIFNNKSIRILKIKVGDDDFRLIYELSSADRLKIL
jgi:hypothetical protein